MRGDRKETGFRKHRRHKGTKDRDALNTCKGRKPPIYSLETDTENKESRLSEE